MRRPARAARRPQGARPPAGAAERLQKLLSRAGFASRREVETWIRAGRLTVNGEVATLGSRAQPGDELQLDGRRIRAAAAPEAQRVFLLHRSPGEALEATLARLPRRTGRRFISVSPMPHQDGGLELVTADGALALKLQRRVHTLTSEFGVRLRGELSATQSAGVLGGTLDSGARLAVEGCDAAGGEGANRWYTLRVRGASGKQVRQLFERQGALVSRVLRTQLGSVALPRDLSRGRLRELEENELRQLLG
ncbi:MAG TPA: S4 domain-containing protein [Steroidobacteraceae bacterium]|jgi:23S rRNA pseudouridine2605 synthase|nr:S4 domain-containing protein [Steroidobacteraceae bacterium]